MRRFAPVLVLALTFGLVTSALLDFAWPLPPSRETTIRELIPLASRHRQFKITEGKDRGKVVPLISQRDLGNEKKWRLVFGDYAGMLLVRGPNGGLMLERLDLFKSRSYVVYEPALPVLPPDVSLAGGLRPDIRCTV